MSRVHLATRRLLSHDEQLCLRINRLASRPVMQVYFATVSRLGDGWFWLLVAAALPAIDPVSGWRGALHMALVGLLAVLLYRFLKRWSRRPRPLHRHVGMVISVAPLDEFSFPSGHTLHAVAFTAVALAYAPMLALVLIPFSLSVAASRVVLGLHYPSDVLAATIVGMALAEASFAWM